MILLTDSEEPDQLARMRKLILAFAVCIYSKTCFRIALPTYSGVVLSITHSIACSTIASVSQVDFPCVKTATTILTQLFKTFESVVYKIKVSKQSKGWIYPRV